jgi:hypothetical protein
VIPEDHPAYDAGILGWALDRAHFNEQSGDTCPPGHYALVIETEPRRPYIGQVWELHVPLHERPSQVFMGFLMETGVGALRTDIALVNDVPEWQVDPDEPPCTREEGLRRIARAHAP